MGSGACGGDRAWLLSAMVDVAQPPGAPGCALPAVCSLTSGRTVQTWDPTCSICPPPQVSPQCFAVWGPHPPQGPRSMLLSPRPVSSCVCSVAGEVLTGGPASPSGAAPVLPAVRVLLACHVQSLRSSGGGPLVALSEPASAVDLPAWVLSLFRTSWPRSTDPAWARSADFVSRSDQGLCPGGSGCCCLQLSSRLRCL